MKYFTLVEPVVRRFRRKRLESFRRLFPPHLCHTIIDVGGNNYLWDMLNYPSEITLVNSDVGELKCGTRYRCAVGDGRALTFADKSFDLAFSNSVIEHVGEWPEIAQFAAELQRVGRAFYCQTPNKWFPVEPHFGALFVHWIPWLLHRYFVVRYLTLWGILNRPSREEVEHSLSQIRLLTRGEMQRLFPGAEIIVERFVFAPKSYIAIGTSKADVPFPGRDTPENNL